MTATLRSSLTAWSVLACVVLWCALSDSQTIPRGGQVPWPVRQGVARLVGHYNSNQMLRLGIVLAHPHEAEEEQFLEELQTIGSPNFHHFLTAQQWIERFAPAAQDEEAVVQWANSQGLRVTHRYADRTLVDLEAPVATIEKAFTVSINTYAVGTNSFFSNDRDPQIPNHLVGVIHSIAGLENLSIMRPAGKGMHEPSLPVYASGPVKAKGASAQARGDRTKMPRSKSSLGNNMSANITAGLYDPVDVFSSEAYDYDALYNLGHCCNPLGNPNNSPPEASIAIATFGDQNLSDIAAFQNLYPYLAYNLQKIYVDGIPSSLTMSDEEGTMDAEWAIATANSFGAIADTAEVFLYDGATNNELTFLDIFTQMLNDGFARVASTSWSCTELSALCDNQIILQQHSIFNSMVARGWTLVAASGDHGATNDCTNVSVSYPASDPNVVAVGGTELALDGNANYIDEVGWTGGTAPPNPALNFPGSCMVNDGGSGGGCSAYFSAPGYQTNQSCGPARRSVPDLALNAVSPQVFIYDGVLQNGGGTSIGAPEMAGFFAQENAYLLYLGTIVGNTCSGSFACAPMGPANPYFYYEALNAPYAAHYPFYDVTAGCNSNDVTAANGLPPFCAQNGYDMVTGWGSANMLQLAWAINTYLAGDFGPPLVTFAGPAVNRWYNTDQTVTWSIVDTTTNGRPATGVAGFTPAWDADPGDVYSHPTPGCCDSFYQGPHFPNANTGFGHLAGAGTQGCHVVHVRAWDNTGSPSQDSSYGPLCYDTVPPTTSVTFSPRPNSAGWNNTAVTVTLMASDPGSSSGIGSGVQATYYSVDNSACSPTNLGACLIYGGPFTITTQARHTVYFFSKDKAGNFQPTQTLAVNIDETAPHTTATLSGTQRGSGTSYVSPVQVTLIATDNLSGIASTVYQIDSGATQTYTGTFTVSTNGSHSIAFHSTDKAGNVEASESVSLNITRWLTQASGTTNALFGISCTSTSTCKVVGSGGVIRSTNNGGATWTAQASGTTNPLNGVSCIGSSFCLAVGGAGTTRVSTNGGTTWTAQTSGTSNNLAGVSCPSSTICEAVGANGMIRATTNGGVTWTAQNSGTSSNLTAVSCPTTSVCVAVGNAGTIRITTNGGATWTAQTSGTSNNLAGVSCPSTTSCEAVGANGAIRATTNAGANWIAQTSGTTNNLNGVSCVSNSVCTTVGASGTILATTNGGGQWSAQPSGTTNTLFGTNTQSVDVAFAVGNLGTIVRRD
jgi:photosystem II stability/assembly factor-like uncharacterized protein